MKRRLRPISLRSEDWLRRLLNPHWQRTYRRSDGAYIVVSELGSDRRNPERFEIEVSTGYGDPQRRGARTTLHYVRTRWAARRIARTERFQ